MIRGCIISSDIFIHKLSYTLLGTEQTSSKKKSSKHKPDLALAISPSKTVAVTESSLLSPTNAANIVYPYEHEKRMFDRLQQVCLVIYFSIRMISLNINFRQQLMHHSMRSLKWKGIKYL